MDDGHTESQNQYSAEAATLPSSRTAADDHQQHTSERHIRTNGRPSTCFFGMRTKWPLLVCYPRLPYALHMSDERCRALGFDLALRCQRRPLAC